MFQWDRLSSPCTATTCSVQQTNNTTPHENTGRSRGHFARRRHPVLYLHVKWPRFLMIDAGQYSHIDISNRYPYIIVSHTLQYSNKFGNLCRFLPFWCNKLLHFKIPTPCQCTALHVAAGACAVARVSVTTYFILHVSKKLGHHQRIHIFRRKLPNLHKILWVFWSILG